MRLNRLGIPDKVTPFLLKKIEQAQTQNEQKPAEDRKKDTKKGYGFYCNNFGHFKEECRKVKRDK